MSYVHLQVSFFLSKQLQWTCWKQSANSDLMIVTLDLFTALSFAQDCLIAVFILFYAVLLALARSISPQS